MSFSARTIILFLAAAASAHAQDPSPTPVPALRPIGDSLTAALNGTSGDRAAFARANLGAITLSERPLEAWIGFLDRAAQQSDGVEVLEIRPRGNRLDIQLRAKREGRPARAILFGVDAEGKLEGLYIFPQPERRGVLPWPEKPPADDSELIAEIDRHVRHASDQDAFSGVVLVARADRVLYHQAFGLAERSFGAANRPDTMFNLASMGKLFTTVAVMQLVERGQLRLAQTVAEILPDYPVPETARQITVAHLLTHTSGLGNLFDRPAFDPRRDYRRQVELLEVFAKEPLAFTPGTREAYSNEGFIVLGAIVERLSGLPFTDYVEKHVFAPAGMTRSDYSALDDVVPNRAVGYRLQDDDPFGVEPRLAFWLFPNSRRGTAAGGCYSTAPDLLRFVRALRDGRLLGAATLKQLEEPHQVGSVTRGLGVMLSEVNGQRLVGHSGGGAGSGIDTELHWMTDGDYTVVVLANYESVAVPIDKGILEYLTTR